MYITMYNELVWFFTLASVFNVCVVFCCIF